MQVRTSKLADREPLVDGPNLRVQVLTLGAGSESPIHSFVSKGLWLLRLVRRGTKHRVVRYRPGRRTMCMARSRVPASF
jgi:hypothetical protein